MKTRCPKCDKETLENGLCSNCSFEELQIPPPPALTSPSPPAAEPKRAAPAAPAAPPLTRSTGSAPDAPSPRSAEQPSQERPAAPTALPPSAQLVSPFERAAPPAPPPADPLPANAQTSTAAALQNETNLEVWEEQLVRAYEEGIRIVTLIGFSGAGKTFFANRLRRELRFARKWGVSPEEVENIPKSPAEIEWTEMTRHDHRPRTYLLADVDGEAYRASVQQLVGKHQTDPEMRRFLLLTAVASAYVLMIPARAALDTPDPLKQTEKLVDRFDIIVGVILALQKRLAKNGNVRAVVNEPVTEDDRRLALRDKLDCKQPVHVLFAQADTYADIAVQERDPYVYAMRNGNALYRAVNKHFRTHRFDFVTAFDGHQENNDSLVDYKRPTYGTTAAFDWIDSMCADRLFATRMTAAANVTRSIIDGGFRKTKARLTR